MYTGKHSLENCPTIKNITISHLWSWIILFIFWVIVLYSIQSSNTSYTSWLFNKIWIDEKCHNNILTDIRYKQRSHSTTCKTWKDLTASSQDIAQYNLLSALRTSHPHFQTQVRCHVVFLSFSFSSLSGTYTEMLCHYHKFAIL